MKDKQKFRPLNEALPEFYLEDLEQRLETAPITTGGLLSVEQGSEEAEDCFIGCDCNCNNKCTCDSQCDCDIDCGCNADCHDFELL